MNKTSSYSYSVRQIIKFMNAGRMNFDFPIQRESGQWNTKQKSLFIHSVIQGYDIPDIYIINERTNQYEKDSVLDGKQRCTTLKEFYDDGFYLSKGTDIVVIEGITYDVAGKKYSQLDPVVQDEFLDYLIRARKMNGFTDKEIEEQFFRLNNGSTFTSAQKSNVKLGTGLANAVLEIANSSFFKYKANFSKRQRVSGEVTNCILQTMMILSGYDSKRIANSDIMAFAANIKEQYENGTFDMNLLANCKYAVGRLFNIMVDMNVEKLLKKTHIPALICNMLKMSELESAGEITENDYREFLEYWFAEGIMSEEYQETCGKRSTDRANVMKRISIINNEMLKYINRNKGVNKDDNNYEARDSYYDGAKPKTDPVASDERNQGEQDWTKSDYPCAGVLDGDGLYLSAGDQA